MTGEGSEQGLVLDIVGLSEREERLYRWLVDKGTLRLTDVVAATDRWWDADDTQAALGSLHAKGLVSLLPGPPSSVAACPPESVLEHMIGEHEAALRAARRLAVDLAERHRYAPDNVSGRDVVDLVYGREAVIRRGELTLRGVRENFRGFDKPPYFSDFTATGEELTLLARGVRCRSVYDRTSLETPGYLPVIERLVAAGEEARVYDGVPMKLGIADDREALLPLQTDMGIPAEMFVKTSALLDALVALFELVWERATPFQLAVPAGSVNDDGGDPQEPSPDELRVLTLLVAGVPDESICRRLGISHRTLQRRISMLQSRVGARTRFQLAYQATRRAWI